MLQTKGYKLVTLEKLLNRNQQWAKSVRESQPDLFANLSQNQQPEILWIGCSDSRIPETQVLDLGIGKVFTYRNIANLVSSKDLGVMAVLSHAINVLKITHIIVCGHYGCSGVNAAYEDDKEDVLNQWVKPIVELKAQHSEQFLSFSEQKSKDYLAELNVKKQFENLCRLPVVESAWSRNQQLTIYGLIYDLKTGLLSELLRASSKA